VRQVVLDTETTGLEASLGHRIIEIACVELNSRRATGRNFHKYLNPERDIDEGARAVHGMSREQLADKPRFAEIADELRAFMHGAELIIHNAPFDLAFLDAEFARLATSAPLRETNLVLDTLLVAREMHPGQRNSLDALCKRYGVDNSHRELHGALLDARLLADVYLAMTGGQNTLAFADHGRGRAPTRATAAPIEPIRRTHALVVIQADAAETVTHARLLDEIEKESKAPCLWRRWA
jgi:DNA polymerase-3 subunit epsilon